MKKTIMRLLSLLLCFTMLFGLAPYGAAAETEETIAETETAETEAVETEPAQTESAETEAIETVPAETEPAVTGPAETEPQETVAAETVAMEEDEEVYGAASGTCGDNLTWVLDEDGVLTISGTGEMTDYYYGPPWKNDEALIRKVIMEPGITGIASRAFQECANLVNVSIPDSVVTIGDNAFCGCSALAEISIPASVTGIGNGAFKNCTGLTDVVVPEGVTQLGAEVFSGCTGLAEIRLPNSLTTIHTETFSGCTSLTGVELPGSLTELRYGVFRDCSNLTSVTIPKEVTSILQSAFEGCGALADVYYSGSRENRAAISLGKYNGSLNGALWHYGDTTEITGLCGEQSIWRLGESGELRIAGSGPMRDFRYDGSGNEAPWYLFRNEIKSLSVAPGITRIGDFAFYHCTELVKVSLPEGLTGIGFSGFDGRVSLPEIRLPEGLNDLGDNVFRGCVGFKTIKLPEGVENIPSEAFAGCQNLKSIALPGSLISINDYDAFPSSLNTAYYPGLPSEWAKVYKAWSLKVDQWYFRSTGPDDINDLCGDNVTWKLDDMGVLTISGTGDMWDYNALSTNDSRIDVPWYSQRDRIVSVVVSEGVTRLGDHACYAFENLIRVSIPQSVTSIGGAAFEDVFRSCPSLAAVYYAGTRDQWRDISFPPSRQSAEFFTTPPAPRI